LKVLDVEWPATATFDGARVLSRPDQHMAWRGDSLPTDPLALIDRVRGASNPTSQARLRKPQTGQAIRPDA
jgi:hypothetical protein